MIILSPASGFIPFCLGSQEDSRRRSMWCRSALQRAIEVAPCMPPKQTLKGICRYLSCFLALDFRPRFSRFSLVWLCVFSPSFTAGNPSEREKRKNPGQESHRGTGSTGRDGRVPAQGKRIKGNAEGFRVANTDIFYRKSTEP